MSSQSSRGSTSAAPPTLHDYEQTRTTLEGRLETLRQKYHTLDEDSFGARADVTKLNGLLNDLADRRTTITDGNEQQGTAEVAEFLRSEGLECAVRSKQKQNQQCGREG